MAGAWTQVNLRTTGNQLLEACPADFGPLVVERRAAGAAVVTKCLKNGKRRSLWQQSFSSES